MTRRLPTNSRSIDVWASYLRETKQTVDDAIERTSVEETQNWLKENRHEIESVKKEATATFTAVGEMVDSEEASRELDAPARGKLI